jgi:hypothetical protein
MTTIQTVRIGASLETFKRTRTSDWLHPRVRASRVPSIFEDGANAGRGTYVTTGTRVSQPFANHPLVVLGDADLVVARPDPSQQSTTYAAFAYSTSTFVPLTVDQAVKLIVRHGTHGLTLERVSQMIANVAADLDRSSS